MGRGAAGHLSKDGSTWLSSGQAGWQSEVTRDGTPRVGGALLVRVPVQVESSQYLDSGIHRVLGEGHMWVAHRKEGLWVCYSVVRLCGS